MSLPVHTQTVLVVDDEPDSLRMLTAALEGAELSVLVATSGQAALDLLGHILPDLILMDAVMPGIDGFETTARIKARPELANVPVIFMTGLTESEHVVEAFEVGGTDYVRKPVNLMELIARVRVHMAQSRAMHASVASLDATGRLMMATDAQGRMLWCTPRAEQAIARLVPEWSREGGLPPAVSVLVERLLQRGGKPGSAVKGEFGESSLELLVIAHYRENEVLIRLNEISHEQNVAKLRDSLDLTQREAEVLLWVGYGKASNDISDVLDISPRTVQKHLERIYVKLGVEKRSAAAAIAIRIIEQ
ncbi:MULTISPECIES: response regulator transcription factor [unclassified Novosphingobium]|uniref:response regulator transcription factor n=1 Tax=unclassified Novosphingobium TaxID=2644732 RepID=UPI00086C273F|nr:MULTISPECIES: DNA-binding response regulator [unclassified Novosphingobium]MBN9143183.1 response regulator [Novosphingobium sp.]MDR6706271.1 DNA-binding NarL/FixJ family response regulator [Novosphingobium sp. 1748]ODU84704.1 MAG: DNA-binding response regulator [Novosphingobium sp. SCN 63-17]OJX89514.1 MAG: DNA-binding response regulator [Novosphingobium sp. 63-713]